MIEQDIKIFGLNIGAILFSIIPDMNSLLQTVVLTLSIVYTVLMIYKKIKEWSMKYFNESEFSEFDKMDPALLLMLDNLRETYGYPIKLTSTYRSPEHPIEAKKAKPGEHAYGAAVDIACVGGEATYRLVKAAIEVGFTRIGISRKNNFVHVGVGYDDAPKMTIWTY